MQPVSFEGASEVGKPKDMTDEQCMSVWATKGFLDLTEIMEKFPNTVPPHGVDIDESVNAVYYLTAWKPSYEDIQAFQRGEPVYIKTLCATGLPPMALFTLDENKQANF